MSKVVLAPTTTRCLTSGLDPPHLEHLPIDAGVIFRSTDHRTPFVSGLREDCRFFAQMKLLPARSGGSLAKPGFTVQAK